jgi:hypothetical protein
MTKQEFKERWESDDDGGGLTMNDIADCAVEWGISDRPKTRSLTLIQYEVLKAAGVSDAEEFAPEDDDDDY